MVEHEFYTNTYHGSSISAEEWATFEARAAEQLALFKRQFTVTAPEDSTDAESMAICAMADALFSFNLILNGEGGVSSASVGGVSTSYTAAAIDVSPKAQSRELYRCAANYLEIYRGVS